jgi:hypothetical protein
MFEISKTYKKPNIYVNDVLKTLLYFDAFQYPLTFDEILSFSQFSKDDIKITLKELIDKKIVFCLNDYYGTTEKIYRIERRDIGNKNAQKILKKAQKVSGFIGQFPFVEAVFVSGSLSKGYFGEGDDIDFFIVTAPNRLWLSRTLLIIYKKLFLLNSKKYFCVNYFMSSNALEVKEKNRFTATEFATLIPMNGNGIYNELQKNNLWVLDYFPNYDKDKKSLPLKRNFFKRVLEFLLNGYIGNILEKTFMKMTKKHQQKKFIKMKKKDFKVAFKGDENTSKHHPDNHQKRIIKLLNKKITSLNDEFNLEIPLEVINQKS